MSLLSIEVVDDLALHALDLQPIAGTQFLPLPRPRRFAQLIEHALEHCYALPRNRQLVVIADHSAKYATKLRERPRAIGSGPTTPVVAHRLIP